MDALEKKGFTPKNSCWNFKGFTLIEIIIVLIILGILVSIGIANYTATIEHTKGDACINNMRTIFAAWRIYNMKEATDYATAWGFRGINIINTNLGTVLDEKYFGQKDTDGSTPGFYMRYYPAANPIYYYTHTYRLSGRYNDFSIRCWYYPNGNATNIYYHWGGTWTWLPPDE